MTPSGEDRAERREVLSRIASRYERAAYLLGGSQWESFRSFVELWVDAYDWTADGAKRANLSLDEDQRRGRFERFRRQASSWDVTLEFPVDDADRRRREREKWRRDFAGERRRLRERAEREQAHWDEVHRRLEGAAAWQRMAPELRAAYERLELASDVTLIDARQRYRELARLHHPDVDGRPEEMVALNEAWELIVQHLLS